VARCPRKIATRLVRACAVGFVMIAFSSTARTIAQAGAPAQAAPATPSQGDHGKNEKVFGLSVIVKTESVSGDPVFHADGYRVRITTPGTASSFNGSLTSMADVTPGAWIRFEGTRDESGVVVAHTAQFYAAGTRTGLTKMGPSKAKKSPDYRPVLQESMIDQNGDLVSAVARIPPRDADALCAWYRVPADPVLQNRVEGIGMRLLPQYQKQLAFDAPARISFRFYVVNDAKVESVLECKPGLVLVPKRYLERIQNDDQLAAVLADGIALNLVRQLGGFRRPEGISKGTALAAGMAAAATPWAGPWPLEIVASRTVTAQLEQQSARIALQLMDDAGFDPWQAPEAWRLLAPGKPPKNLQSLKDTRESKYQLSILNLQYKPRSGTAAGSDHAEAH